MILPDIEPVLRFPHLVRNAGTDHFGKAVDVDGGETRAILDVAAHLVGPGLGPEDTDLQRAFLLR
jgi:hypothetical protein